MATTRDPKVRIAPALKGMARQQRRPQHRFSLIMRPYQIQPFMIAPVLPGETMTNMLMQARVVTDPLKPQLKLVGWWFEHFYFYIKHRDLPTNFDNGGVQDARALATSMVLDPATDMTPLQAAADEAWTYTYQGGINWTKMCEQRVVEEYFREEGENWNSFTLDGVPMAAIYGRGTQDAAEHLTLAANKRTDESGFDLLTGGTLHPRTLEQKWQHWAALREAGLTQMDYQDFVNTYGSETREDETSPNLHRPELLGAERMFQYPTNIVDATTGVPSVAVAWSVGKRVDKDYRFNEPGFILGLVCCRPKVYLGNQDGSIVGGMQSGQMWLPAVQNDNYELAYQQFTDAGAGGTGPFRTVMTQNYWLDMRDIFRNGDQFLNYDPTAAVGTVTLPDVAGQRRYASTANVDALFNAASPANKIYVDGACHLAVKGYQHKNVPGTTI